MPFSSSLPLLIYFLTRMGIVSAAFLKRYRRHAFVILLVISAIITPPDIFSLILVIIPLYGLYELSIRLAARIERKRARRRSRPDFQASGSPKSPKIPYLCTGSEGGERAVRPGKVINSLTTKTIHYYGIRRNRLQDNAGHEGHLGPRRMAASGCRFPR